MSGFRRGQRRLKNGDLIGEPILDDVERLAVSFEDFVRRVGKNRNFRIRTRTANRVKNRMAACVVEVDSYGFVQSREFSGFAVLEFVSVF